MGMQFTFRKKLFLLTIVPLAVAQVVTLMAVMRTVERDIETRARESLHIGVTVVDQFLLARAEHLRTSIEVLAADYGLKEAAATLDRETIRSVLDNHSSRVGADIAAILDLDGKVLASTGDAGVDEMFDAGAITGDDDATLRELTVSLNGTSYHVFAVPLKAPLKTGWIALGFRVDRQLIDQIRGLTGLDAAIVEADAAAFAIASSLTSAAATAQAQPQAGEIYAEGGPDEQILAVRTPLVGDDSRVFVVLQRSMREAMLPYIEARRGLIVFGLTLLVFVAAAGVWFSTTISSPLQKLAEAARRMISGDYKTGVAVQSDDELGALGTSFNAMQQAIAERERRISYQALHDPLTELPNRSKILAKLRLELDRAQQPGGRVSVVSIHLQRMNEISSTLGHTASDELIKMAALQLHASLDNNETLGHIGTDEFVLILPDTDTADALAYVERIDGLFSSGVSLGRVNVILQIRAGIAEFPRHGEDAADLLRYAVIARTEAETYNDRQRVYEPGREEQFVRRLRIVNDLPGALRRKDVQLWLQPKISLPDGRVCGAEALVRWEHAEFGLLTPDEFVPAAEQAGTIIVLTRHMLAEAARAWHEFDIGSDALNVSVNLSARDLLDEYLPYHVMQILEENELEPRRLTLEVTESSIMEDLRHAVSVLECISDIGVRVSMDDFGTGHSSLAQLRNIPLDELKIDKSFVMNLSADPVNESIVETTVQLAHSMGLTVVAEGVEDEDCLRRIAAFGCEQAQGYFISKPMPAARFVSWVNRFEPRAYADRRSDERAFAS